MSSSTIPLAREKISMITQGIIQKKNVSIENDGQQVKQFENFLDPNLPICVIGCEGKVGTGKSTLMSLIALHLDSNISKNDLFTPSATTFSATPGCSVLNKKLVFNGVQIVLMDFEGQGGLIDPSRNMEDSEYEQYLNKLMCLSFVIPSVLIVVSHQRIQSDDINKLKYLESIHRRMTTQKINLPTFKWFIKEGYQLNPQTLASTNTILQTNCPSILKNTNLVCVPYLDQSTLDFSKRQKFQVIEDLLHSATSSPQSLPNKSQFLKIFNDTFSLINNNDFEGAYGQKLGYYRVWEEWNKIEGPKFEEGERQLSLKCEKIDDNGDLYEIAYKSMIQVITEDINKRLENDGISTYSVAYELNYEIQTKFDLKKAKTQFLTRKKQNQDIERERKEAEEREGKQNQVIQQITQDNKHKEQLIQLHNDQLTQLKKDFEELKRQKNKKNWFQKVFGL